MVDLTPQKIRIELAIVSFVLSKADYEYIGLIGFVN